MGMFDKPKYLTGGEGYVTVGETFYLHNARIDGTVNVGGKEVEQAKLLVSRVPDGETDIVYTSGKGIVGQVRRMTAEDRQAMPMQVRLDDIPGTDRTRSPTHVLTPADQPAPAGSRGFDATAGGEVPPF